MPKPNFSSALSIAIICGVLSQATSAADIDQLSKVEIKEKWGQVIFCQSIYKMPEVKPRLYDFDLEQCNAASKLANNVVAQYPQPEQRALKDQAERHARAISYNTNEPYQAVPACREYCRKLSELLDEQ